MVSGQKIEVSGLSKIFNSLLPVLKDRADRDLYRLANKGLSATQNGDEEELWQKIRATLRRGADVNKPGRAGETILGLFAGQNLPLVVQRLVDEAGALPDAPGARGTTPLMLAAYCADTATIKFLLSQGADPNAINNNNATAVSEIIDGGTDKARQAPIRQTDCLKLLIAAGAVVSDQQKSDLFHRRAELGDAVPEVADALALQKAIWDGDKGALRKLVESGVHPEYAFDKFGGSLPFAAAAWQGDVEMMRFLRSHGANPNSYTWNSDGPPLLVAAQRGHLDTVRELLALGADPALKLKNDRGDLMSCAARGRIADAVEQLLTAPPVPPDVTTDDDVRLMKRLKFKPKPP